ncbi:hypothetical protein ACLX1H_004967 [Fusarium chlamydosporum]
MDQTHQTVEREVVDAESDSVADGESTHSSTASVSSSLYEYRKIQGRTYQNSHTTDYWAPNDDKHVEAFDVAHEWLTMMLDDELYAAPIGDSPQAIAPALSNMLS